MEINNSNNSNFSDDCFASEGHEAKHDWFAFANHYSKTVHNLSLKKNQENERKKLLYSGKGLRYNIYNAINSNHAFLGKVKKPFVVNTTAYAPGGIVLQAFVDMLIPFFETDKIINKYSPGTDPWEIYKGLDLILPLLYCDKDALEFLPWKANQYIECGIRSVTALFLFRIVPNELGQYPNFSDYPHFTENVFGTTLNLSGKGDFISQLAFAMEDNTRNQPKYLLL